MVDVNNIFSVSTPDFAALCRETFEFQYTSNQLYREWCKRLGRDASNIRYITDIPALPIVFFKQAKVHTTEFAPQVVFESSGTSGQQSSYHEVKDVQLYEQS
jgi:phenylacetate-coenzyme A ligase PaaK-like adenylate-forming protein